jgi:hypothetical protein
MVVNLGEQIFYFNAVNKLREVSKYLHYHNCFLFSAYHFWKKSLREVRDKGIKVMVDSGGFQIKSMTDKNYFPLREVSYWQLTNSDITAIRDFGLTNVDKNITYKLEETYKNAKFLLELREEIKSETKILGVVHGASTKEREEWADKLLTLNLDGFAFGAVFQLDKEGKAWTASGYDLYFGDLFYILKKSKELKWGHFFAMTAVELIGLLPYLYKRVNENTNYKISTLSWDNSSPQTAAYLYNYITPYKSWRIAVRVEDNKKGIKEFKTKLPCFCDVCRGKTFEDLYNEGSGAIATHNLIQYLQKINYIFLLFNNNKTKWEKIVARSPEASRIKSKNM